MAMAGSKWLFVGIPCPGRMHCNNGGSCTFFPRLNIRACNCTGGYEGERCEYKSTVDTSLTMGATGSDKTWTNNEHHNAALLSLVLNILTVALLSFIVITMFRVWKNRRARRNEMDKPLNEEEGLLRIKERGERKRASSLLGMLMGWDSRADKPATVTQCTTIQCGAGWNPEASGKTPKSKWRLVRHHFLGT